MIVLPDSYKEALAAMKEQARFATMQIVKQNRNSGRDELLDAQKRMALYPVEVKSIMKILLSGKDVTLNIDTLDDIRLAEELEKLLAEHGLVGSMRDSYLAQFGRA